MRIHYPKVKKNVTYLLATICLLLCNNMIYGQSAAHFFKPENIMLFGTYYYPEQWPRVQWERDIKKMADMGFDFTHYGEFAWAAMEPEEGRYDFSWLDTAVVLAEKYGLKVVMCTPTPTPPVWLTEKHPDVLIKNESGIVIQHGRRQHASWSSDTYREYVERIVTELAKRYGNSDVIVGWQIDNEPSHYGVVDYSDNAQRKFKAWLENKYETIDNLNDTWGNAFWSQTYENFEQVRIPNAKELPEKANPHAMLDFQRFCSDEVASFVNGQADVLRQHISPHQWITTNTMPNHHPVDPNRMDRMDFHTYTRYLVNGGDNGHGEQGFRMGSNNALAFHNDTYRNYPGKVYGVMELQPGQVNWGGYNPQPYPGAIRLWLYHVMAGGGKFVCNYRFRQPLKGSEQYHYGMILTDGVTPSPGGEEYMQTIKEMAALKENFNRNARMPEDVARRKTAILYDIDSEREMNFQPQTWQWSMRGHLMKYYNTLKSFGAPVDIISDNDDFDAYPVLVVPAYELLDNDLVDRWRQYAENGGQLVLTCRTGQKNREAQLWETKLSEPIYELIGAENIFYDHLPPEKWSVIKMDGGDYAWNNWGDVVTPKAGTDVWGAYSDQFYKGKAAVTHRKAGKGSVTFIGADTDDAKLEKAVLKKLYVAAAINTLDLPDGVTMEWRDGFYIALNYSSDKQTVNIPDKATILIGSKELEPAGVVVWKE